MSAFVIEVSLTAFARKLFAPGPPKMDWDEEWRGACRELLLLRREELQPADSKRRPSWQAVRNEIMKDFDRRDEKAIIRDERLTRQDLANFANGMRINPAKFVFIDRYIRHLECAGLSDAMRKRLRHKHDERSLKALASMYRALKLDDSASKALSGIPQLLYAADISSSEFRSMFLFTDLVTANGASIVIGYCKRPMSEMSEDDGVTTVFYSGYLLPMTFERGMDKVFAALADEHKVHFKELNCIIKAYRSEYRGLPSISYADGEVIVSNYQDTLGSGQDDETLNYSSVKIDYPNPIANPWQSDFHRPDRYREARVSQRDKAPWSDDSEQDGIGTSSRTDFFDTETWRFELQPNRAYNKIIENILYTWYKGYVF